MSAAPSPPSFEAIQAGLRTSIYRPSGGSAGVLEVQTYCLMAFLGLAILCNIVSLVARYRRGSFWLYRLVSTRAGATPFIVPHSVVTYLIFNGFFSCLLIVYAKTCIDQTLVGKDLYNVIMWKSAIWWPLWFSSWNLAWATALQPLLLPTRTISPGSFDLARHPKAINAFMIIIPILFFISEQITAGIASSHYNIIFSSYLQADAELTNSIALVKEGGTPTNLGYIMTLLKVIKDEKGLFIIWWRSLWIVSAGFVAIEMTLFLAGAKVYFATLSVSIKNLQAQRSTAPSWTRQLASMKTAYRSLVLCCISSCSMSFLYCAANVYLALNTEKVANDGPTGVLVSLVATYIQAIIGTLISVVLLSRSFTRTTTPVSTTHSTGMIPSISLNLPRQTSSKLSGSHEESIATGMTVKLESETVQTFYRADYEDMQLVEMKKEAPFSSHV